MKKRKISLRSLKFIPIGGDPSHAICRRDQGFMHLCHRLREVVGFSGYTVDDTKGVFDRHGFNNVNIDWSTFRQAWLKASMEAPPEKPSVFYGVGYSPEHSIELRRRLLAAAMREYTSPERLAEDVLAWLSHGREKETRNFMITLLHGVGWMREPPRTAEAAAAQPIVKPQGHVLMIGP